MISKHCPPNDTLSSEHRDHSANAPAWAESRCLIFEHLCELYIRLKNSSLAPKKLSIPLAFTQHSKFCDLAGLEMVGFRALQAHFWRPFGAVAHVDHEHTHDPNSGITIDLHQIIIEPTQIEVWPRQSMGQHSNKRKWECHFLPSPQ